MTVCCALIMLACCIIIMPVCKCIKKNDLPDVLFFKKIDFVGFSCKKITLIFNHISTICQLTE